MTPIARAGGAIVPPLHRQQSQRAQIGEQVHKAATTVSPREVAQQVIDTYSVAPTGGVARRSREEAEANRRVDTVAIRQETREKRTDVQERRETQAVRTDREITNHRETGDRSERADDVRKGKVDASRGRTAHLDDAAEAAFARAVEARLRAAEVQIERAADRKRQRRVAAQQFADQLAQVRTAEMRRDQLERRELDTVM